jgi:hypothetical protein
VALANRYGESVVGEDVRRLVVALYGHDGRLPGRRVLCEAAGISEVRYAALMDLLVARGALVGRSDRKTGRLAHASAEETLAALGAAS